MLGMMRQQPLLVCVLVLWTACVLLVQSTADLHLGEKEHTQGVGLINMCSNNCNGHGKCVSAGSGPQCECDMGWGSEHDITEYRSPTCMWRTCPTGTSWGGYAYKRSNGDRNYKAVAHEPRECSNIGVCNKTTGKCACPAGYAGEACERTTCPNGCSGHGQCMSMKRLSRHPAAQPLSWHHPRDYQNGNKTFGYAMGYTIFANGSYINPAWEAEKIHGCLCYSSWSVGLLSGETQASEYFGPDCSMRRCPSANDPETTVDETNCEGVKVIGTDSAGAAGNLCHVDCANRGTCDYQTGNCACYKGYYGVDCTLKSALSQGTTHFVPQGRTNDDSLIGRRSNTRRRPDTLGRGVDDPGVYFNDDML